MTKTIAVANQKGGVGKTTTAVNLATALAAIEKRILLVDLDPQGNASTGLGLSARQRGVTIYDLLSEQKPVTEALHKTLVPNLTIIPSSVDLSAAEIELINVSQRTSVLKNILAPIADNYDYIFLDCPPSLGLLTLNAMAASNAVLVPLQCEFYALEGLSHLLATIKRIKQKMNPKLEIMGVVLTMIDRRNNLSQHVEADVREFMGDTVYKTVIPRNVRISEAPSHGKPALLYDYRSAGAKAYMKLARELLTRERKSQREKEGVAA